MMGVRLTWLFVLLHSVVVVVVEGQGEGECRDRVDYYTCYNWSLNGMCTEASYRQLAMENCQRTCNLCWGTWTTNDVTSTKNVGTTNTCRDNRATCSKWTKHCRQNSAYYEFMSENCQRTCRMCEDASCADINKRCDKYRRRGYCDVKHMYHEFMKKNCELTCTLCAPPSANPHTTSRTKFDFNKLTKEFLCDFEVDECDWINQPFDDTADWSVGRNEAGGPLTGFKGSTGYLYLEAAIYEDYYANLLLPWQLVLPDGVTSYGKMCLHFMYVMNDGKLSVAQRATPTSRNKFPPTVVKFSAEAAVLTWTHAQVEVFVSDGFELVLKGTKGVPHSYMAVDYLFFTKGGC